MPNSSIDVSLPEAMLAYVQERVAEGAYRSPAHYVRALIREDMKRRAEERLDELLLEGLNSGPAEPMTEEDWAYIRAEAQRRAGAISPKG